MDHLNAMCRETVDTSDVNSTAHVFSEELAPRAV